MDEEKEMTADEVEKTLEVAEEVAVDATAEIGEEGAVQTETAEEVEAEAAVEAEAEPEAEAVPEPEAEAKSEDDAAAKKKGGRKRFKRWQVTVGVIVIVVIVAGAGFWVWHNQPGFCDAICHNPQDPYNPTYYAEPGEQAVDKWGNEVEDASSMLAATHRAYGDLVCIDCHDPVMKEQIVEGFCWLTGNYYNPLSERDLENLTAYSGKSSTEFCLNESCHNMTKDDLREATSNLARNPHEFHHSEYTCSDCHKSHRASIMVCTQCHDDAVTPDGWLTYEESQELETIYGAYDLEELYSE